MNSRIQNQLNMVRAVLQVAQTSENTAVWDGQEPLDFAGDLTQARNDFTAISAKAAQAEAADGGAADEKAVSESALEQAAYVLARALAFHFKKTGDLTRHGKVNYSKSAIVRLRTQELVNLTSAIRDVALTAVNEPQAASRGVTQARIDALTAALASYTPLMSAPRSQIVNRSVLTREIQTDVAALLEKLNDLDDLVLQFDTSDAGRRFGEAWKQARIIVDVGGGRSTPPATPPPAPAPVA